MVRHGETDWNADGRIQVLLSSFRSSRCRKLAWLSFEKAPANWFIFYLYEHLYVPLFIKVKYKFIIVPCSIKVAFFRISRSIFVFYLRNFTIQMEFI